MSWFICDEDVLKFMSLSQLGCNSLLYRELKKYWYWYISKFDILWHKFLNEQDLPEMQLCVNYFRGHVGPWTKSFRSPQENLWAHNEIRFIEEKYKRKSSIHDVNVHGFSCQCCNHAHTFTFSTGEVSSSLNNTACSVDNLFAYNFPNDMPINVICISPTSI